MESRPKYFVHQNTQHEFNFDLLVNQSGYLSLNREKLQYKTYINLVDEFDFIPYLTTDIINNFISFFQTQNIEITPENAISLNLLSIKYDIPLLSTQTNEYISSHHKEIIDFFLSIPDKTQIYTDDYEQMLIQNFEDYLHDDRLFNVPVSILYRIVRQYYKNNPQSNNQDVIIFLFDCLTKIGIEATVLFKNVNFQDVPIDILNQKLSENSMVYDFSLNSSIFCRSVIEINRQLIIKDKEKTAEIERMKENFVKEKNGIINEMQNKINQLNLEIHSMIQKVDKSETLNKLISSNFFLFSNKSSQSPDQNIEKISSLLTYFSIQNLESNLQFDFVNNIFIPNKTGSNLRDIILLISQNQFDSDEIGIKSAATDLLYSNGSLNSSEFLTQVNNYSNFSIEIRHPSSQFSDILEQVFEIKHKADSNVKVSILYDGNETVELEGYQNEINSILLSTSVSTIVKNSFKDFRLIKEAAIPLSVKTIEERSFENCTNLVSVPISSTTVKTIGESSFKNCESLTGIVIPSSVEYLGDGCFEDCKSLKRALNLSSVKYIGDYCFKGCSSLVTLLNPPCVEKVAFEILEESSLLTKIVIPSSVEYLGNCCFEGCSSITKIEIPNSVKIIGENAFKDCQSLAYIYIPSSVTQIGINSFKGCHSLVVISIPQIETIPEIEDIEKTTVIIRDDKDDSQTILHYYYELYRDENTDILTTIDSYTMLRNSFENGNANAIYYCAKFLSDEVETKLNDLPKVAENYKELANQGQIDSMYAYGMMLKNGIGIPKNTEEAIKYIKESADNGQINSMNEYGLMLKNGEGISQNLNEALKYIKESASRGQIDSMYEYGMMLKNGDCGVEQNNEEALNLLKNSALKGQIDSMYEYGMILKNGDCGVEQNNEESVQFLKKSAEKGQINSMYEYGLMLKKGELVPFDKEKAVKYLKESAKKGQIDSMYEYGLMLKKGEFVEIDKEKAVKYLVESADKGQIDSMYEYGLMLKKGELVPMNHKKAVKYLKESADKGQTNSMIEYSLMLKLGNGVPKDINKSIKYLKDAADKGNIDAIKKFAWMLDKGEGITQNRAEAAHYFKLAADKGDLNSMCKYGFMLSKGVAVNVDKEMAAHYFKMAADGGHIRSMRNYAKMLNSGSGVEKNVNEANRYLKMAELKSLEASEKSTNDNEEQKE